MVEWKGWEIKKHEPERKSLDIYGVPSEFLQCTILAMGTVELKIYYMTMKYVSDCRSRLGPSHVSYRLCIHNKLKVKYVIQQIIFSH